MFDVMTIVTTIAIFLGLMMMGLAAIGVTLNTDTDL